MIDLRIKEFKKDLYDNDISEETIYHSHFRSIEPFLFIDSPGIRDDFINNICEAFGVKCGSIVICGSLNAGYSIAPNKRFGKIDHKYNKTKSIRDKSDIDIAIISNQLYGKLKRRVYKYTNGLKRSWHCNEYYPKHRVNGSNMNIEFNFYQYNYKGWFRPDYKPRGFEICDSGSYEILKRNILTLTGRKLAVAIYEEPFYLDDYSINNIKNFRRSLSGKVL